MFLVLDRQRARHPFRGAMSALDRNVTHASGKNRCHANVENRQIEKQLPFDRSIR